MLRVEGHEAEAEAETAKMLIYGLFERDPFAPPSCAGNTAKRLLASGFWLLASGLHLAMKSLTDVA